MLGQAFEALGYAVDIHHIANGDPLPEHSEFDAAVVLGSKWSVYDDAAVGEWIDEELAWMRDAQANATPLLGVCFGAQAMAMALGGAVEPAPSTEIGWVNIVSSHPGIAPGPWFQFHGDRCLPPTGVEVLATNELCVQAFRSGSALAVQFHPEIDPGQLSAWMQNGAAEVIAAHGIDADVLLAETRAHLDLARENALKLVQELLKT